MGRGPDDGGERPERSLAAASAAGDHGRDDLDRAARATRRAELGRAMRAVRGVAGASVVAGADGRDRLRLRLEPGEPVAAVRAAVAATLRERFGIVVDPDGIRQLAPAVPPGARCHEGTPPADGGAGGLGPDARRPDLVPATGPRAARTRAVISDVHVEHRPLDADVVVTLAHAARSATSRVEVVAVQAALRRGAAEATLGALRELTDQQLLAAVDEVRLEPEEDPATATVVITAITARGEHRSVGSALVQDGVALAVARATLDALNRHVEGMLISADRGGR